ncbi:hypothetical protein, partial [Pseudomonas sp. LS-2]|uniref:hypothetical protein n=1 Tax=Pseudomonas sp. LS-2 TaxID=2315859 RepID=UPI001C49A238
EATVLRAWFFHSAGRAWFLILPEGRGSWLACDLPGTGSKFSACASNKSGSLILRLLRSRSPTSQAPMAFGQKHPTHCRPAEMRRHFCQTCVRFFSCPVNTQPRAQQLMSF